MLRRGIHGMRITSVEKFVATDALNALYGENARFVARKLQWHFAGERADCRQRPGRHFHRERAASQPLYRDEQARGLKLFSAAHAASKSASSV